MVFLGGVYHVTEMYVTFCHLYIVAVGGVEISWFRGHLPPRCVPPPAPYGGWVTSAYFSLPLPIGTPIPPVGAALSAGVSHVVPVPHPGNRDTDSLIPRFLT